MFLHVVTIYISINFPQKMFLKSLRIYSTCMNEKESYEY